MTAGAWKLLVKEAPWAMRLTEKLGDWPAKLRRIAYFLKAGRALVKWRSTRRKIKVCLEEVVPTLSDLQEVELILVREVQMKHFQKEIETLFRLGVRDPLARKELRS